MGSDLVEFVSSLGGGDGLRVEESLGNGFVRLRIAEAERRQAKHDIRCVENAVIELLRNARDADARRIFVATTREENVRTVYVIDDGTGIPPSLHRRVFDARVTSKLDTLRMDRWGVHGRGMALYSIDQNALGAQVVDSNLGLGTCIVVSFDTSVVSERADQSTWPTVLGSAGSYEVRGPRNAIRACVEFALEEQGRCNVYYGSPSELLATMRTRVSPSSNRPSADFASSLPSLPLVERPGLANDARQMREVAHSLGIHMSERNAHRIVRGQIAPLRNVLVQAMGTGGMPGTHAPSRTDARALPLSNADRTEFEKSLEQAFARIAQRYYVTPVGAPRIVVGKGSVRVTFEYEDDL